jgi:adenylate cyclase
MTQSATAMSLELDPQPQYQFVPLRNAEELADCVSSDPSSVSGPSADTVTKWLAAAAELHRTSASSTQFFSDAARFAVDTVGLDAAWVLSYSAGNQNWQVAGSCGSSDFTPDDQALAFLAIDPITQYESTSQCESQTRRHFVVVSPVLSTIGELIGAVYGVRDTQGDNRRRGIRPLEARMIELLAQSVAVGIARLAQETEAARARVLLEQAFSPTVAEHIQRNPDCLAGQLREVTLLFADLRGFTSLAECLPPADCYRLLGEVMEELTRIVIEHQGIVVDYYGDGLLALWNAPIDQANHADLACGSAIAMLDIMPEASQRWHHLLRGPLELGIGVHSGPVLVGNAGTLSRLKYGPRGNNVNIASRVQAATKELDSALLVTVSTQRQLSSKFFSLRVCTARLPGLEQPVELFAVYPASDTTQVKTRLDQYAHALRHFEEGDIIMAEVLLNELVTQGPATPARFLARQAALQRFAESGRRASDRSIEHGGIVEIHEK